jgi:hypothetical protein
LLDANQLVADSNVAFFVKSCLNGECSHQFITIIIHISLTELITQFNFALALGNNRENKNNKQDLGVLAESSLNTRYSRCTPL